MELSENVLGHYAVAQLRERIAHPVLTIGRDAFTRAELARVECFNFMACRILEEKLKQLRAKSVQQVYNDISPTALAIPGLGVVGLAVLGAAFEARKLGNGTPLESWMKRHLEGHMITFNGLKNRVDSDQTKRAKRAGTNGHKQ